MNPKNFLLERSTYGLRGKNFPGRIQSIQSDQNRIRHIYGVVIKKGVGNGHIDTDANRRETK